VGTCPYSDTASDCASLHSLSEPPGEDHAASLRLGARLREEWIPPEFLSARRFGFSCGVQMSVVGKVDDHLGTRGRLAQALRRVGLRGPGLFR
jgi:hypothetical protein